MRKTTPSYIVTLRLKTEVFQEDILNKRFELSRKLYNACVNELYKRYRTLQQSKSYKKVIKMKKGKAKNDAFSALYKHSELFLTYVLYMATIYGKQ